MVSGFLPSSVKGDAFKFRYDFGSGLIHCDCGRRRPGGIFCAAGFCSVSPKSPATGRKRGTGVSKNRQSEPRKRASFGKRKFGGTASFSRVRKLLGNLPYFRPGGSMENYKGF